MLMSDLFVQSSASLPGGLKQLMSLSKRFQWGMLAMSMPVAYIIGKHINWKSKPDSRKRMIIHHLVFWPMALLGLKTMHVTFRWHPSCWKRDQEWFHRLGALSGAGVITAGFELGDRLAKALVPKKAMIVNPSTLSMGISYPPSQLNCPFRHSFQPIAQHPAHTGLPVRQLAPPPVVRPYSAIYPTGMSLR